METTCSFEMSADFQQTTRHYIPEDRTIETEQDVFVGRKDEHLHPEGWILIQSPYGN
jgi:hypothetical protein